MTLDALDTQLKKFLAMVATIEEAGLIKSPFMNLCRQTVLMMEGHATQCRRAVECLRKGDTDGASRELGDYVVQHTTPQDSSSTAKHS
jgi:hypothetical protein